MASRANLELEQCGEGATYLVFLLENKSKLLPKRPGVNNLKEKKFATRDS